MPVRAVVFDWGGTLTPWFDVDLEQRWLVYAQLLRPDSAHELATTLAQGERYRWDRQFDSAGDTGTGALEAMFQECGIDTSSPEHTAALSQYLQGWEPHTHTDPDAAPLLERLRASGVRTAVLSNTMWPRWFHEQVLRRDGVLHLFDYLLFTSETESAKPHKSVFADVLYHLDALPEESVFVGDRLFDDIHGAQAVGMRAVWIPHTPLPAHQSTDLGIVPDATAQRLADVWDIVQEWNRAE